MAEVSKSFPEGKKYDTSVTPKWTESQGTTTKTCIDKVSKGKKGYSFDIRIGVRTEDGIVSKTSVEGKADDKETMKLYLNRIHKKEHIDACRGGNPADLLKDLD